MVIGVDFDGVLHDPNNRKPGRKMGEPVEGAIDSMKRLSYSGHDLIIHTVRGGEPKHVEDWLKHFEIPYHSVTNIKPNADLYLDDRGYRFVSWTNAMEHINWLADMLRGAS